MQKKRIDKSQLDACGWNSFDPKLFFKDEGRRRRDIGGDLFCIIQKFCKGNRILELCSGGGRLLIHLARQGLTVTGIDLSKEMLHLCRMNIESESKSVQGRIRIIQDDMCTFDFQETFDFIILEDDGFMYLLTKDDQLSCLQRVSAHLSDNGFFFLSFATPQKELNSASNYEYDTINQVKTQPCEWTILDQNGHQQNIKQGFERRRLTYPEELECLLALSQLSPVACWGDLQMNPFTDPLTQDYNYLIEKHQNS